MEKKFNLFNLLTQKSSVFYLKDSATLRQAFDKFSNYKFSVIPIINEKGEYVTSVSEGDILRFIVSRNINTDKEFNEIKIIDIKKYRPYISLNIDSTFDELYAISLSQNFIPIVDDRNIFIGIIRRREIMIYLKSNLK